MAAGAVGRPVGRPASLPRPWSTARTRSLPVPLVPSAGIVSGLALSMVSHIPIRSLCPTPTLAVTGVFHENPSFCELRTKPIRARPITGRPGCRSLVQERLEFCAQPVFGRRRDRQHSIEISHEGGSSARIRGRELPSIDPPIQFPDQV